MFARLRTWCESSVRHCNWPYHVVQVHERVVDSNDLNGGVVQGSAQDDAANAAEAGVEVGTVSVAVAGIIVQGTRRSQKAVATSNV